MNVIVGTLLLCFINVEWKIIFLILIILQDYEISVKTQMIYEVCYHAGEKPTQFSNILNLHQHKTSVCQQVIFNSVKVIIFTN